MASCALFIAPTAVTGLSRLSTSCSPSSADVVNVVRTQDIMTANGYHCHRRVNLHCLRSQPHSHVYSTASCYSPASNTAGGVMNTSPTTVYSFLNTAHQPYRSSRTVLHDSSSRQILSFNGEAHTPPDNLSPSAPSSPRSVPLPSTAPCLCSHVVQRNPHHRLSIARSYSTRARPSSRVPHLLQQHRVTNLRNHQYHSNSNNSNCNNNRNNTTTSNNYSHWHMNPHAGISTPTPHEDDLHWKDRVALYAQFSAEETLHALLHALQLNARSGPRKDDGIDALYAFANVDIWAISHRFFGKKQDLGQFERFKRVVVAYPYNILLRQDYSSKTLSALHVTPDVYVSRKAFHYPDPPDFNQSTTSAPDQQQQQQSQPQQPQQQQQKQQQKQQEQQRPQREPLVFTFTMRRLQFGGGSARAWMVDSIIHDDSSKALPGGGGHPEKASH